MTDIATGEAGAADLTGPPVDPDKLMAFVLRAVEEAGAALNAALVVMGDRLGYYRSLTEHGPSTPAELAERTDTDERVDDGTGSDTPKYFHYVKKDKIAESAVIGTHVVALCGEVFPVTKAAKPGSPVCPDCKKIYDRLKK